MTCSLTLQRRVIVTLGLLLSLSGMPAWAGFSVVLKDGKVIEAKTKPILLEGRYRFTGSDNKFHAYPADQIDQAATDAANRSSADTPRKPKVLTNEDVSTTPESPKPDAEPDADASGETKLSRTTTKSRDTVQPEKPDEQYWRRESRKLRDQIAAVNQEIEKMKAEISKAGSGGFDVQRGRQQDKVYIIDRDSRLKKLQKQRDALQSRMDRLQEDGRKAGAPPGWFR